MLERLFKRKEKRPPLIQRRSSPFAESRWAAVMPPLGRKVKVTALSVESDDAVRIGLAPLDGGQLNFKAGQYLGLCLNIDGQAVRRP